MLGIDTSKDHLVCALLNPQTERFAWQKTVPNTPAGWEQLLSWTPDRIPWVLEPTGRYSLAVAKHARAAGRIVLLAPPRKAKAYLNSRQDRAKTDRLDSCGLALFAASRGKSEPLSPYPIRSETLEKLHQFLRARRGIADALARFKLQCSELPHAAGPLKETIAELERQRKALDRQIAELTGDQQAFPELDRLLAVPGIGPLTAASLLVRLKAGGFPTADAFVAFCGLDIGVIRSGKRKGEKGLTRQGDAELRRLFYLGARSTVRTRNSPFRARYEQELAKGRPATAAINVIARKLARTCWSIVRHGSTFDPAHIYKQRAVTPEGGGPSTSDP